jgi:hypothetical protein
MLKTEQVSSVDDIEHAVVIEALRMIGPKKTGIEKRIVESSTRMNNEMRSFVFMEMDGFVFMERRLWKWMTIVSEFI